MVLQCINGVCSNPVEEKNNNLTAQKYNSNTVWFNFQTYVHVWKLNLQKDYNYNQIDWYFTWPTSFVSICNLIWKMIWGYILTSFLMLLCCILDVYIYIYIYNTHTLSLIMTLISMRLGNRQKWKAYQAFSTRSLQSTNTFYIQRWGMTILFILQCQACLKNRSD